VLFADRDLDRYTTHASKAMIFNHKRLETLTCAGDSDNSASQTSTISVIDGANTREVTVTQLAPCSCSFYQQQGLPWCHTVRCCQDGIISLENLVFGRRVKAQCNVPQLQSSACTPLTVTDQPVPTFRRVESVVAKVTELIMACGDRKALERLNDLERLVHTWEDREPYLVNEYADATAAAVAVTATAEERPATVYATEDMAGNVISAAQPALAFGADQGLAEAQNVTIAWLDTQIGAAEIPTAAETAEAMTSAVTGDSADGNSEDREESTAERTLREMHLRLSRVRGRGNVRKKKTVTFAKHGKGRKDVTTSTDVDLRGASLSDITAVEPLTTSVSLTNVAAESEHE